ncbi:hypothetical protein A3Q56_03259 [Intoshia linei]|uniref:Uncharacterized protein n=1 Tax=Intoshia linei TaxID=1819745 RepID=A0A177B5M8_9BILA|nr:hypothetical protein A3Q56_03259 [Intoshia linei]
MYKFYSDNLCRKNENSTDVTKELIILQSNSLKIEDDLKYFVPKLACISSSIFEDLKIRFNNYFEIPKILYKYDYIRKGHNYNQQKFNLNRKDLSKRYPKKCANKSIEVCNKKSTDKIEELISLKSNSLKIEDDLKYFVPKLTCISSSIFEDLKIRFKNYFEIPEILYKYDYIRKGHNYNQQKFNLNIKDSKKSYPAKCNNKRKNLTDVTEQLIILQFNTLKIEDDLKYTIPKLTCILPSRFIQLKIMFKKYFKIPKVLYEYDYIRKGYNYNRQINNNRNLNVKDLSKRYPKKCANKSIQVYNKKTNSTDKIEELISLQSNSFKIEDLKYFVPKLTFILPSKFIELKITFQKYFEIPKILNEYDYIRIGYNRCKNSQFE